MQTEPNIGYGSVTRHPLDEGLEARVRAFGLGFVEASATGLRGYGFGSRV